MNTEIDLLKANKKLTEELYSATSSARRYKHLYEKERDSAEGRPLLREHDRTRLIAIREYIDELLGRWDKE